VAGAPNGRGDRRRRAAGKGSTHPSALDPFGGVARISFDFGRRAIQEATSWCAGRVLILLDFERASTKLKSPLFDFDTAIWSGGLG